MGAVSGPDGARTRDLVVLADLTRDGVFEKPLCFESATDDCASRYTTDPLAWWLTPHTDAPDRILARQFDHIGQCFHFMAQSDDENGLHYTTPSANGGPHAAYGLIWDAYDRCVDLLGSLVANVVQDPVAARANATGMYELMHAIMDSYSLAHVERDYATWAAARGCGGAVAHPPVTARTPAAAQMFTRKPGLLSQGKVASRARILETRARADSLKAHAPAQRPAGRQNV